MEDVDPEGRPTLGYQVLDFIEARLCHGPGDVQGHLLVGDLALDDELARFILRAYALDGSGRRLFDEALLSRAKGRRKSELAGLVACVEAVGPARFDGWDAAGEPVGRPVTYPFIRCLATEEEQAGNTFDNVAYMLDHLSAEHGDEYPGIDLGRGPQSSTRIFLPDGGEVRPSTAAAASKDGGKESFAVADETHLYNGRELRQMYRVVKRNMAKRREAEPWMLQTTTMFAPGEESIAELTFDVAAAEKARAAGGGPASRLLLDHRGARTRIDLADDAALRREIIHVYGAAAATMDVDRLMRAARDPVDEETDRRRYWLNEKTKGGGRWIDPAAWAQLADSARVVADGALVAVGFDGSRSDDSTGLVGMTLDEAPHLFVIAAWERPDGPDAIGWEVDEDEVTQALAAAMDRYSVALMFADPPGWYTPLLHWQERWGAKVRPFETRHVVKFSAAADGLAEDVRAGDAFTHDADPRLAQHIANTYRVERSGHTALAKDRKGSPRKIDLTVCAVLARAARAQAVAEGLHKIKRRRVVGF